MNRPRRQIVVQWGDTMDKLAFLTPAQYAALCAVRDAVKTTTGHAWIGKTTVVLDHEAHVNALAVKRLEKAGLVETWMVLSLGFSVRRVGLTDRGRKALEPEEAAAIEASLASEPKCPECGCRLDDGSRSIDDPALCTDCCDRLDAEAGAETEVEP